MNREIKFRAWDEEAELWRYFTLYDAMVGTLVRRDGRMLFPLIREGQFTGLKDKNGKEIYEGDYLAVWDNGLSGSDRSTYEVKWFGNDDYPAFDMKNWPNEEVNGLAELLQSGDWEYEVVGNIYENPSLLQ